MMVRDVHMQSFVQPARVNGRGDIDNGFLARTAGIIRSIGRITAGSRFVRRVADIIVRGTSLDVRNDVLGLDCAGFGRVGMVRVMRWLGVGGRAVGPIGFDVVANVRGMLVRFVDSGTGGRFAGTCRFVAARAFWGSGR